MQFIKLNKNSYRSDVKANLYRAALYLARGSEATGLEFLKKSWKVKPENN